MNVLRGAAAAAATFAATAAASADEILNRNIYVRCLLSASLQLLLVFDS